MRILLIEDDKKTASYLKKGLGENHFVADIAADGEEGSHLIAENGYDLIILDVMLPGKDGWTLMDEIRKSKKNRDAAVLFLTAKDAVQDRVRGFELGADDYLVKPFAFSELLARIRSLLRRAPVRQSERLSIAGLELDPLRHRALRDGTVIDLTQKEFMLLLLLMRRQGETLSRTLIAEHVWDINFDSDSNVVEVAIRRLRAKVDDPFPKKLIHTIRGIGYVLEDRSDR